MKNTLMKKGLFTVSALLIAIVGFVFFFSPETVFAEEYEPITPYAGIYETTVTVDGVGVKVTIDPKDMPLDNYVDIHMVLTNNDITNIARFHYTVTDVLFRDVNGNIMENKAEEPQPFGKYSQTDVRSATVRYKGPKGSKSVQVLIRITGNNHATGVPDMEPVSKVVDSKVITYVD